MKIFWQSEWQIGYADPVPSNEELGEFYQKAYRQVMNKRRGLAFYSSNPNYLAQVKSQIDYIVPALEGDPGIWLDVGAGYGLLISEARRRLPGWLFWAVEADEDARTELVKLARLVQDERGFWQGAEGAPTSFDVISVSHVLEHLVDPWEALGRFWDLLKPGGVLMIEVPHDDLQRLTSKSRVSDIPHLWFFSMAGLERMIRETGFELQRSGQVGILEPGKAYGLCQRIRWFMKRKIKGPLALVEEKAWYGEGRDRADIRVLARKPKVASQPSVQVGV